MPQPKLQRQKQAKTVTSQPNATANIRSFMNTEQGEQRTASGEHTASRPTGVMADEADWRRELAESLQKTEDNICSRLASKIDDIRKDLNQLSDRVTTLEHTREVTDTQVQETFTRHDEQLKRVQDAILLDRVYQRKYNLLLYGIPQSDGESAEGCVRQFMTSKLGMDQAKVDAILFANVHRLPRMNKVPGTADPIIMKFLAYPAREEVFRLARQNGPKLRDLRLSLRSDLPPELKAVRGKLATKAYSIRKDNGYQTRISERGITVTLEYRESADRPWKRIRLEDNI